MSTAPQYDAPSRSRASSWPTFVAVYLLVAGTLNAIWGIVALANKSYFVEGGLVWAHLNMWAWIAIVVGAVQIAGSALVFTRHAAGAMIAGTLAFIGILLNFLAIGAYPIWSVILLVIDALIIYGVTAHLEDFVDS